MRGLTQSGRLVALTIKKRSFTFSQVSVAAIIKNPSLPHWSFFAANAL